MGDRGPRLGSQFLTITAIALLHGTSLAVAVALLRLLLLLGAIRVLLSAVGVVLAVAPLVAVILQVLVLAVVRIGGSGNICRISRSGLGER